MCRYLDRFMPTMTLVTPRRARTAGISRETVIT
jgi:hypothetical protein